MTGDTNGRIAAARQPEGQPLGQRRAMENPGNLTSRQQAKLAWIEKTHLYRAYLLKEGLRTVFRLKGKEGKYALTH